VDRSRSRAAGKRALDTGNPGGIEPRCTKFCRTWFRCAKFLGAKGGFSESPADKSDCAKCDSASRNWTNRDRTKRGPFLRSASRAASADRR
jgi:hypothetical protein